MNQHNHVLLELEREFETRNNKEYEVKVIINNVLYKKKQTTNCQASTTLFCRKVIQKTKAPGNLQ